MSKKNLTFDYSLCVSCGICAQACPLSCLTMTKTGKQGKYRNVFPELGNTGCTGCGLCVNACPMGVITLRGEEQ